MHDFFISLGSGRIFCSHAFDHLSFPLPCHYDEDDRKCPDGEPPARSSPCISVALRGLFICCSGAWGQEPGGEIWGRKRGVWAHERRSQEKAELGNKEENLQAKRELCFSNWTQYWSEEDLFWQEMTKLWGQSKTEERQNSVAGRVGPEIVMVGVNQWVLLAAGDPYGQNMVAELGEGVLKENSRNGDQEWSSVSGAKQTKKKSILFWGSKTWYNQVSFSAQLWVKSKLCHHY